MKKSQLRRGMIVILAILMLASMLSACGGKSDPAEGKAPESTTPETEEENENSEESTPAEEGEAEEGEAEEGEAGAEEGEAEEDPVEEVAAAPKVVWVVGPTIKYRDIGQISSRSLKFQGDEWFKVRRTCIANNKGYPQEWGKGVIPESEGGGTISYSPNAIAVARESGYMQWGIVDYDGNVLFEPTHSPSYAGLSPFTTPGYVNIYGGIGFYGDAYYSAGADMFEILSGDYSTVVYSFNDMGGYGVPELEYCIEEGKLYHMDSGYPTLEFSETTMVDIIKDTLVPEVPVSWLNGKADNTGGAFYNQGGYAYIDESGNVVAQSGYFSDYFVNGYYKAYANRAEYEAHWYDESGVHCAIIKAETGEGITDFIYEDALYFEEGYCPVRRDGKWGFIDTSGTEVTEMIFDKVSTLYEGKFAAIIDGEFSIINLKESIAGGPLTKALVDEAIVSYTAAREEELANKKSDMRFPEDFVGGYTFSSGAGGWGTSIELKEDGTFVGAFHDSEMGSTGEDYPYGTVFYCNFSGKFVLAEEKAYNVYSVKLEDLVLEDAEGEEKIEEGVRRVASGPYGIAHGEEFIFMGEGADGRNLSEASKTWLWGPMWMSQSQIESIEGLPKAIMVNVNTEDTFARP